MSEQGSVLESSFPPFTAHYQAYHPSHPSETFEPLKGQMGCAPCPAPVPVVAQNLQQTEERLLNRMVDMFQGMMEKMQQRSMAAPSRGGRSPRAPGERRARETACRVCNDSRHTTVSHCRSDGLCFSCLAPGHNRANCTANNQPSQPQSKEN